MQRVADEVVDQCRAPANAQAFVDEAHYVIRRQMMSEQSAAHQIEARVAKGKGKRIAYYRTAAVSDVRRGAVEQCNGEHNPATGQRLSSSVRDVPRTGCDFQER
jgi:hypothetical protein